MMKNIFYLLTAIGLSSIYSCHLDFNNVQNPYVPPCNNTEIPSKITLDFSNVKYNCPWQGSSSIPVFFSPNTPVPFASKNNYTEEASFNGNVNDAGFGDNNYLCSYSTINAYSVNAPACDNPGNIAGTWQTAGTSLSTSTFQDATAQITVEYYDVCAACSATGSNGRPHFIGSLPFPAGTVNVKMVEYSTAVYYTNSNCQ